jgi:hypothetical protein
LTLALVGAFVPPALAAVTNPVLSLGTVDANSAVLNWTDGGTEKAYKVYQSSNGTSFSLIATLGADIHTYTRTGLIPDTDVWFRVDAKRGSTVKPSNVVMTHVPLPPPPPPPGDDVQACLANPTVTVFGVNESNTVQNFGDDVTFDGRSVNNTLYPSTDTSPTDLGRTSPYGGLRACSLGGVYTGQQSRSLDWQEVKNFGGWAMILKQAGNALITGLEVDNIEDGFAPDATDSLNPASGDGWVLRNAWFNYIRDDCVEGDRGQTTGVVSDVLFDGCYVFYSTANSASGLPVQSDEQIIVENSLIFHKLMPSPVGMGSETVCDNVIPPDICDTGNLLKWDPDGTAPSILIRNTIILEDDPSGAGTWPAGTVLENVTIVKSPLNATETLSLSCTGSNGCTQTTDMSVWNNAVAAWKTRHGCTTFPTCTKLMSPDPA